ncbi:WD repeat-containing protein 3 [Anopheles funestus]|uniref:WD repeat-containing protein 3 n=1 Tax=Anopheles funestus TaxID=62324 RepID=UPI0020C6AA85|nr:WD repeat-containing protein 3 [Anopheles funestus]
MGLTKQYLAYKPVSSFNIIASGRANISFVTINHVVGRYVVVAAAEKVLVWDMRIGEKVVEFVRDKQEVTFLRTTPDNKLLAVGYSDGLVELFSFESKQSVCSFASHRSAVSALNFDLLGLKLVSGGLDNDLVVSDVVSQTGKCRLTGHTAPITQACFMQRFQDVVVSSSKDTQIKFWNIETQCCFKTIVDHRTEVWDIVLMRNDDFLVCATADTQLSVYKISPITDEPSSSAAVVQSPEEESTVSPFRCTAAGSIQRAGHGRTINLVADVNGQVLGCHGTDRKIELFYFCSEDESVKKLAKRLKKLNTNKTKTIENGQDGHDEREANVRQLALTDEVKRLTTIATPEKVKSFDLLLGSRNELRICCTFLKNFVQLFSLDMDAKNAEPETLYALQKQGHPSEARTVTFSSDNLAIASGSAESLKLWSRASQGVLRTVDTDGYVVSTCFVPGDRHVLVGLKSGELLVVDVVPGEIIERIEAHEKELWSIILTPDKHGCVSGGGDTTVKFWSFELIGHSDGSDQKVLSLLHKNTLKLEETVLCVRISQNGKYIAVALLDNTVKIFFLDSLKFYLSLYGHKLPVIAMDISYDSTLIITGSGDRTIKIWGMDFGDCHRSLLAHDNTVTAIQFIPNTHMFFSCAKDGKLKQWDADSFQKIITLPGHLGEAHALAISPNGKYIVSCGSDRTLRLFHRTEEPLVLQDVQEEEREELENATLATGEESTVPGLPGLRLPSKKTIGSEKGAESILECLEVSKEYEDEGGKGPLPPLMFAYSATNTDEFLLTVLSRIRASDLEESLLLLPFSAVCVLLEKVPKLTVARQDYTELICKVVLFLFRVHQKPIVSNQVLLPVIQKIVPTLQAAVSELRDMVGTNLHAGQMLQRELEENDGCVLFRDATKQRIQRDRRRKRREASKRKLMQIVK